MITLKNDPISVNIITLPGSLRSDYANTKSKWKNASNDLREALGVAHQSGKGHQAIFNQFRGDVLQRDRLITISICSFLWSERQAHS